MMNSFAALATEDDSEHTISSSDNEERSKSNSLSTSNAQQTPGDLNKSVKAQLKEHKKERIRISRELEKCGGKINADLLKLMKTIDAQIVDFINCKHGIKDQISLPPMSSRKIRDIFKTLASIYNLNFRKRGKASNITLVLYRTSKTVPLPNALEKALRENGYDSQKILNDDLVAPKPGSIVGQGSHPITRETSIGYGLLEKMSGKSIQDSSASNNSKQSILEDNEIVQATIPLSIRSSSKRNNNMIRPGLGSR